MNTVLITGCSSGFGLLTAKKFQAEGWNVIATMRAPDSGAETSARDELSALDNVLVARLDVTDPGSIDAAIDEGITRFGAINALVNNAGFGSHALFELTSIETARAMFDTNFFGCINTMRAMLPLMRKQGGGVVVNVASVAGFMPIPLDSVYCASKHAVNALSAAMAFEYEPMGVRLHTVEPGGFPTTGFDANLNKSEAGGDDQLIALEGKMTAHIASVIESMASGNPPSDPQLVADKVFECVTGDTPLHNPVGDDALMMEAQMVNAASRQAFFDQLKAMLMPADA